MNSNKLIKLGKLAKKNESYLYSLPFLLTAVMLNLQFFAGLMYQSNPIYTILNVLASAILYFWLAYIIIKMWIFDSGIRKYLICAVLVVLLFVICYGIAIIRFGLSPIIQKQLSSFVLFGPLALFVGAVVGLKQKETDFFSMGELFCYIAMPIAIHYVVLLVTNMSPYDNGGIGIVDYMQLSYAFMPMLFILTVQFIKGNSSIAIISSHKSINILRAVSILIYWLLILGSATRGAILGVLCFLIFLAVFMLISKRKLKRLLVVGGAVVIVYILLTYVVTLPGMERLSRMEQLTSNFAEGELSSANDAAIVGEVNIDVVVQSDNAEQYGFYIGKTIKNRTTIFTLAWKEALKAPLTGMGPFAFSQKYGSYPHNFVLELFCELGFVFGGLALCLILYAFVKLAIYCFKDFDTGLLLVFLCGYLVQLMVSGTVWARPVIMFGLGYGLCYLPKIRGFSNSKKEKAVK